MFKKFSILQWVWFWFASGVIYFLLGGYGSAQFFPLEGEAVAMVGGYFWAGLIVVIVAWIVSLAIKWIKREIHSNRSIAPTETKSEFD